MFCSCGYADYCLCDWQCWCKNNVNMGTVKPKSNSINIVTTLETKQCWWESSTRGRKHFSRHTRIHVWMKRIRLSAKPFKMFTTLSKTKNPVQPSHNYCICRFKTTQHEVHSTYCNIAANTLPCKCTCNLFVYHWLFCVIIKAELLVLAEIHFIRMCVRLCTLLPGIIKPLLPQLHKHGSHSVKSSHQTWTAAG